MNLSALKSKLTNVHLDWLSVLDSVVRIFLVIFAVQQPAAIPGVLVLGLLMTAAHGKRDLMSYLWSALGWTTMIAVLGYFAYLNANHPFDLTQAPSDLCALVAVTLALVVFIRNRRGRRGGWANNTMLTLSAVALALCPTYFFLARNEEVMSLQIRNSMRVTTLDSLPETIEDRLLPRATAETYLQNLNDEFMTSVDKPHLQLHFDGKLQWQGGVNRDDRWGAIFGSTARVLSLDAAHTEQTATKQTTSSFFFGDKSWVVKAGFGARHPFSRMAQCTYYQKQDGTWTLLVSFTTVKPSFSLPAPGLMVPCYGGVMEVTPQGLFHDWSPAEAAERFPGAVLYPAELLRKQAESYARWHDGWRETVVWQKGVLQVSEDTGGDAQLNPLPYVQHFRDLGLQLTLPFEPKGDKQFAFVELLMADAASGILRRVVPPKGLIGPRQARLNVRTDNAMDWSSVRKIEPMLVVAPRGIFWRVALISQNPGDPERHPYLTSVLVDAQHANESFSFRTQKELTDFLSQPAPAQ